MSGTNIDASGPVFAEVVTRRVPNAYDPTALALEVSLFNAVLNYGDVESLQFSRMFLSSDLHYV